jgi:hypothetical protein
MHARRLVLAAAAVALGSAAVADVRFVDDDAELGADGLTWSTAYRFLQDALHDAMDNPNIHEIRVAQGTYRPDRDEAGNATPGDRDATFRLINGVSVIGGYAGIGQPDPDARDIERYEAILSGDLLGDDGPDFANSDENSFHVTMSYATTETAVLDGFTVIAGYANGLVDRGGGMYNLNSRPTIANCKFAANMAGMGGGMANSGVLGGSSSPHLVNCAFSGNEATGGGGGGAMLNDGDGTPRLTDCLFHGNQSTASGGGAIVNRNGSCPVMTRCSFVENSSAGGAGALSNSSCSLSLIACTFIGNSTGANGGGIGNANASLWLEDCVFQENHAFFGGALSI